MTVKKYDSTVCRIAGNLLSGRMPSNDGTLTNHDDYAVIWAVRMARAIVSEEMRQAAAAAAAEIPVQKAAGLEEAQSAAPTLIFLDVTLGRRGVGAGGTWNEFVATPSIALLQEYAIRECVDIVRISGLEYPREVREKITKLRATDQGVRRCRKGVTDEDLEGRR